jgi:hypothetical protein
MWPKSKPEAILRSALNSAKLKQALPLFRTAGALSSGTGALTFQDAQGLSRHGIYV